MKTVLFVAFAAMSLCMSACAQTKKENKVKTNDILVAYFSATGNTAETAKRIAVATGGDLYEITPEKAYTAADLDWTDKASRSSVEMNDVKSRPAIKGKKLDAGKYNVIFIGYPIWVETAAPPIRTFLTTHDLAGKTVVPFCTSGTSSAEASYRLVRSFCPQSTVLEGIQIRRGTYDTAYERVIAWLQEIGIVELNNEGNDEK